MSTNKKLATVVINLSDVVAAGGVRQAIEAFCEQSDTVSCGVIGQSFATSGPGPGWSKNFGANDFASRAFEGGALAYIDADDGRVKRDLGGCYYTEGEWSDESEVYVECPDIEDAMEHPEFAAEMAESVIDHHHALSDVSAWKGLIEQIQAAADAFEDIDADDLPTE